MTPCVHPRVSCLNPYTLIRKYRCQVCGGIMMCACEEEFGRRFLPHQLREAVELETQERHPVSLGFQAGVCNTCRGLPEEAHPRAPTYGGTSKIVGYYWREIWFEQTRRFAAWAEEHGYADVRAARAAHREAYKRIEREVVRDMRALHECAPKYRFRDEPQSETIAK